MPSLIDRKNEKNRKRKNSKSGRKIKSCKRKIWLKQKAQIKGR